MKARDHAEHERRSLNAIGRLVEWISPWLVEVGGWVFGGMIALNLVAIAGLITVGPVDRAVLISLAAFACALPLDVVGIVLLRLTKDVQDIRFDELALKAFQEAQFPDIETYLPPAGERESFTKRRARIALAYALLIAALSLTLTLLGLVACLWHMAPWAAGVFVVSVAVSVLLLVAVAVHSIPPTSQAERESPRPHQGLRPRKETR